MGDDALIDVRILRLAPGGDAVGPQVGGPLEGRTTFVALAAPGERVTARVIREKARVAWAELVAIRDPSVVRVPPPCPLFGRCGGCQWQHVALGAQREAKREIVARALGLSDVALVVPVESGEGYRDRAQLSVGAQGEVGFRARRSHVVVDVERCLLLAPELEAPLAAVRAFASGLPVATEIDLLAGRQGVLVAMRLPPSAPADAVDSIDGRALLASWASAGVVGLRIDTNGCTRSFGAADVDTADAGEAPLRIPAGAFGQVGRAANAALLGIVLREVGVEPGAVLELYAGSGNFTRHIVGRATRVVACDGDPDAVARGRRNAPKAAWSRRPRGEDIDADTVLVDPPREGLDGENLAASLRARRHLVYVSCDPQTLRRDVAKLTTAGLVLRHAVALDLMPHTFHIEVVAVFDRA